MKGELIGLRVSETKKGTVGTTLSLAVDFDEYSREISKFCEGVDCVQEWVRGDYSTQLQVGQTVSLVYGKGYGGRAVLKDIIPVIDK